MSRLRTSLGVLLGASLLASLIVCTLPGSGLAQPTPKDVVTLDRNDRAVDASREAPPQSPATTVRASPNPSRGPVHFAVHHGTPYEDPITVQIVSIHGRSIREARLDGASRTWSWDGRDADGNDAPTGAYYFVVRRDRTALTSSARATDDVLAVKRLIRIR